MFYYELWGEQCSICLRTNTDYYFKNECLCTSLICLYCISKLIKCPYCRYDFTSNTFEFIDFLDNLILEVVSKFANTNDFWNLTNEELEIWISTVIREFY